MPSRSSRPLGPERPDVLSFTDYRAYLSSYARFKRATVSGWSLSVWARQLGIASRSTLSMILGGTREPSLELVENMSRVMGLTRTEAAYFEALVRHGKSRHDPGLRLVMAERLTRLNPKIAGEFATIDIAAFEAISAWYYYAIREMVRLSDFVEDPAWIAQRLAFKVSVRDVRRAIDALLRLGLLRREATGRLVQASGRISTGDEVAREALKNYHEQVLEKAHASVRQIGVKDRYLGAVTFTCRKDKLEEAKVKIRRFESELLELMEEDGGGDVTMQLAVQLFPYTREPTKSGGSDA